MVRIRSLPSREKDTLTPALRRKVMERRSRLDNASGLPGQFFALVALSGWRAPSTRSSSDAVPVHARLLRRHLPHGGADRIRVDDGVDDLAEIVVVGRHESPGRPKSRLAGRRPYGEIGHARLLGEIRWSANCFRPTASASRRTPRMRARFASKSANNSLSSLRF